MFIFLTHSCSNFWRALRRTLYMISIWLRAILTMMDIATHQNSLFPSISDLGNRVFYIQIKSTNNIFRWIGLKFIRINVYPLILSTLYEFICIYIYCTIYDDTGNIIVFFSSHRSIILTIIKHPQQQQQCTLGMLLIWARVHTLDSSSILVYSFLNPFAWKKKTAFPTFLLS